MSEKYIILFDGVCNLCNSSVNFIIDRDKKDKFRFAALQSAEGQEELRKIGMDKEYLDSIVLIKKGKLLHKSTAALHISKELTGLWPIISFFLIIPKVLRDFFYDIIAANRYKWFGRQEECRIPSPDLRSKFLNTEAA
ncbi:thiol-disulfide oxidoreductase DCC family protein [Hyphobacterium sp. CCMP332]|nr:thiol-disulfide oxidoreductase DCC family protein [Hyphobacterium sp. CCMP332]